jgi:hypothetical protein
LLSVSSSSLAVRRGSPMYSGDLEKQGQSQKMKPPGSASSITESNARMNNVK